MTEKYRKIINNPRPVSKKRPQMSLYMRSAQFAPYAALTGYEAVVRETARLTDEKIPLDEYEVAELDRKLREISEEGITRVFKITYFIPDKFKKGGRYVTENAIIKRIDTITQAVITECGKSIPMKDILNID